MYFVILESEYTSFEPSGTGVDSLYYSVDTIVTNGGARVVPSTSKTKIIHIINLIDTYILLTTIGFFIVKNVKINMTV